MVLNLPEDNFSPDEIITVTRLYPGVDGYG